jgi:alkylhydroperoxidase family enzyme
MESTTSRIAYASRASVGPDNQDLFDRLEALRGNPVENIFLAIANAPDLCDGVLAMAMSLRRSRLLDRQLRELAVITVGLETKADYEVAHHWNSAVKAGVSREKLNAIADFETATVFSDAERIVMRFAQAVTRSGRVDDALWGDLCGVLDDKQRLELVLTVAWYNCVVRILLPLQIGLEEWHERL